jgi:CO/xanthine dehydrogenase Mo-binding subunit
MSYVGKSVTRKEDNRLLRGIAPFVGDIKRPGMLYAAIFRSAVAHAKLKSLDVERARKMPGIVAVFTFADMADVKVIPMRLAPREDLIRALQRPLASDRIRYVGEPLAVVVGESRYEAEDALEVIEADIEELDCVVDAREAIKNGAPVLHPAVPDNIAGHFIETTGDVQKALAGASLVIEEEFYIQRHSGVPLETRGLVAEYDAGQPLLTIWGPTKVVHFNHLVLASLMDMPPSQIRMIELENGGGYGIRGEFYPEDFLIPFVARKLRKPVCWIEDRNEHLKSANHSREQWHRVKIGAAKDGRIVAFDDVLLNVMGGYIRTHGSTVPTMTAAYLPGPYKWDNYRCDANCVLVNKTPAGTYRGPGRFGAAFVRERIMDMVAHKLGLDPAEVRLKNFIPTELMPYNTGTTAFGKPTIYDSGDYPKQFQLALEKFNYYELKKQCENERKAGRAVGIGIGCFVEKSGLGPWEYARVEMDGNGSVVVFTGACDLGQGIETVLSQVVADALPIDIARIRVVHGDTAQVPFGGGSYASRGTVVACNSAVAAVAEVRKKLLQLAAVALQSEANHLSIETGMVVNKTSGASVTFADLAKLAMPINALPIGITPGISGEGYFAPEHMVYPYGVHMAHVEVDQHTGLLKILKYLIAYDIGRAINPMLVDGQLVGGMAQGLGGALLEEFAYDEQGQLLTGSFADYLLPSTMETPPVQTVVTEDAPSPLNPLGVKGAGEGGAVGVGAALANAICDALDGKVEILRLPLTPERVLQLVKAARRASGTN